MTHLENPSLCSLTTDFQAIVSWSMDAWQINVKPILPSRLANQLKIKILLKKNGLSLSPWGSFCWRLHPPGMRQYKCLFADLLAAWCTISYIPCLRVALSWDLLCVRGGHAGGRGLLVILFSLTKCLAVMQTLHSLYLDQHTDQVCHCLTGIQIFPPFFQRVTQYPTGRHRILGHPLA